LVLGETLANAARPGEILVHGELEATAGLTPNGTANVRFGGTTIRAASCTALAQSPSNDDSRPTHPLIEDIPEPPFELLRPEVVSEPPGSNSSLPPPVDGRVSLRPASPSAPPFLANRSLPPGEGPARATPPPKPSSLPPPEGGPRRSVPPKKPPGHGSGRPTPPAEDPDPGRKQAHSLVRE
jgi:hypothetical protein